MTTPTIITVDGVEYAPVADLPLVDINDPLAVLVDKLPKGGTTLDCMGHAVATFSDVCALLAIEH